MKLLHIIGSVNPAYGGPIEGLRQLAPAMAALGHTTEVVAIDQPGDPWVQDFPACVHALGPGQAGEYRYAPLLMPWLREHASEYDVVIVRGVWQYLGFATWRVLRHASTPYAVFTHGMLDPWFRRRYPAKHVKKAAYWALVESRILRDAAAVLFTSEEERQLARRSFRRPFLCNEVVVNYGTSAPPGDAAAQRAAFFARYPNLRDKQIALFLSRIDPKKGCDLLIRAFAQVCHDHPDWHLVIAGPDLNGWESELRQLASRLGIEQRTTWTGMLSGDLKWGAYRAADVFVLPSHSENFGVVVAEALACGLPVLISDQVNIWREIESDGAALVGPDTTEGAVALFRRWLEMPAEMRAAVRQRAIACFARRFEVSRAAANLADVLARMRAPADRLDFHAALQ